MILHVEMKNNMLISGKKYTLKSIKRVENIFLKIK